MENGGEHLKALGYIKSLYDLKEVTYLGFTRVLFGECINEKNICINRNVFKIKKKINETVKEITSNLNQKFCFQ